MAGTQRVHSGYMADGGIEGLTLVRVGCMMVDMMRTAIYREPYLRVGTG